MAASLFRRRYSAHGLGNGAYVMQLYIIGHGKLCAPLEAYLYGGDVQSSPKCDVMRGRLRHKFLYLSSFEDAMGLRHTEMTKKREKVLLRLAP